MIAENSEMNSESHGDLDILLMQSWTIKNLLRIKNILEQKIIFSHKSMAIKNIKFLGKCNKTGQEQFLYIRAPIREIIYI